jgi:hypothetical protein
VNARTSGVASPDLSGEMIVCDYGRGLEGRHGRIRNSRGRTADDRANNLSTVVQALGQAIEIVRDRGGRRRPWLR